MERKSPGRAVLYVALATLAVGAIGVVEYLTTYRLVFEPFFLVPIIGVTWRVGQRAGFGLSLVTFVVWGVVDRLSVPPDWPHLLVLANAVIRLAVNLFAVHVVGQLRARRDEALRLALVDPLTGVANGRALRARVALEVERSRRKASALSLAFLDLDDFKHVNDTRGHDAGDDLLKRVAATLRDSVRASDLVARVGGDEFVLLLPETEQAEAQTLGRRVHDGLGALFAERGVPVGASIGIATFAAPPPDVEEMLRRADGLMYAVKKAGKGALAAERWPAVEAREPGTGGPGSG